MNTSTQHPPSLSGNPQEGNLHDTHIPTPQWVSNLAKGISKRVGDFIEVMKNGLENQRKLEDIAVACEKSDDDYLVPYAKLIRETGNVNEKDSYGDTALMRAVYRGHTEITQLLLARSEIQINEKNPSGDTTLMDAAYRGHTEITQLLLARSEIQINEKNPYGNTALALAAYRGHTEITQLLLADQRLDLRIDDQWKQALKKAKTPEIKTLIEEAMRKQGIEF